LPDTVTIGGTLFGIATFSLRPPLTLKDAIIGAVVGFAVVYVPFGLAYKLIRGRTGMGLGDAKLVMLAGGWFGWPGAVFVLLAGAVQGTIAAIVILLTKGKIEEPAAITAEREAIAKELAEMSEEERAQAEAELAKDPIHEELPDGVGQARIAFGPFLVLATLEYLLVGPALVERYVRWLTQY
jgi:leader peptidase (prepilin peptidase)/N-methyltransferase